MFFLGFFPAGEQNVPHALAYGIHALEVRFFPFVDDLGLFLPAAVSPLSIPQPVTPLDAVSEAIVSKSSTSWRLTGKRSVLSRRKSDS